MRDRRFEGGDESSPWNSGPDKDDPRMPWNDERTRGDPREEWNSNGGHYAHD